MDASSNPTKMQKLSYFFSYCTGVQDSLFLPIFIRFRRLLQMTTISLFKVRHFLPYATLPSSASLAPPPTHDPDGSVKTFAWHSGTPRQQITAMRSGKIEVKVEIRSRLYTKSMSNVSAQAKSVALRFLSNMERSGKQGL